MAFIWKGGNVTFELDQTGSAKNWACTNNAVGCKAVYRTTVQTWPASLQWLIPDGLNVLVRSLPDPNCKPLARSALHAVLPT